MRRISTLFSRRTQRAQPAAPPRKSTIEETICAPKPEPKRCLNEGGHKAVR
ncbi:MAG TPA: hypothetical protein VGL51_02670 [Solirubrobacteraceae bacterium]|jgi:hypothetical protein